MPNFDITQHYLLSDTQDFLVRNQRLGAALAAQFDSSDTVSSVVPQDEPRGNGSFPRHNLVLMRSHGFSAVATDIKMATYEGVYALINAKVEAEALKLQHAYTGQAAQGGSGIAYLSSGQVQDSWQTEQGIVGKPWALWVREVRVNPLYMNALNSERSPAT